MVQPANSRGYSVSERSEPVDRERRPRLRGHPRSRAATKDKRRCASSPNEVGNWQSGVDKCVRRARESTTELRVPSRHTHRTRRRRRPPRRTRTPTRWPRSRRQLAQRVSPFKSVGTKLEHPNTFHETAIRTRWRARLPAVVEVDNEITIFITLLLHDTLNNERYDIDTSVALVCTIDDVMFCVECSAVYRFMITHSIMQVIYMPYGPGAIGDSSSPTLCH